ncbi:MAG: hypothetical protein ACRC5A_00485 [Enterobacteriaceae bacterium]
MNRCNDHWQQQKIQVALLHQTQAFESANKLEGIFHPCLILISSLAKAFGTGSGGVLVFPTHADLNRIKQFCSTYIFSGPPPLALINAGIAVADIHLSPEIIQLQKKLQQNFSLGFREYRSNTIAHNLLTTKGAIMDFDLPYVIRYLPGFVYWTNTRSEYIGCNDNLLYVTGYDRNDLFWAKEKEYASTFKAGDREAMKTEQLKIAEHKLLVKPEQDHSIWIRTEQRPFYNAAGQMIGTLAVATDIAAQKDNEHLAVENERTRVQFQQQEEFRKRVSQVVRDLGSPLASLSMMLKMGLALPKEDRDTLKDITTQLSGIAANLLTCYRPEHIAAQVAGRRKSILIYLALLDILAEKRYQYQDMAVTFKADFRPECCFVFAEVEPNTFKSMLSNIINDSVNVLDSNSGEIMLGFTAGETQVKVKIDILGTDTGMSETLVNKIANSIPVTEGKEGGHGMGMVQMHEKTQCNQSTITIDSEIGKGTSINLTFLRSCTPNWIAEQITVSSKDTVVILDDEPGIYNAWTVRFTTAAPDIPLRHFEQPIEAIEFINGFAHKEHIFLLTKHELLKQFCNGLEVIEQTRIQRAVLVTDHYANPYIQEKAVHLGVTVLPKQLAAEVPIIKDSDIPEATLRIVDAVVVDDDKSFVDVLEKYIFAGCTIDKYQDPHHFLENINHYPKQTKIYLDNYFQGETISGIDMARKLHSKGHSHLYLLSGGGLTQEELPDYLTFLSKLKLVL